ncbi:PAS and ANTAR domain-containing protein [Nocardia thraciensis]
MKHSGELSPDDARQIERVIGAGTPQSVGSFRFWFADQRWEWSDEVAAMHGYEPGSVRPTTELLLEHKHPEDRELVATTLARSIDRAEPFCSRHRIIDTMGQTHHVIVVGDQLHEDGAVVGTTGYYVDVTETLDEHKQETLSDALPELYEARAVIEQAKGGLMLVYGIGAEQAFRVLTWRSQETNVKLRALAQELVRHMVELGGGSAEVRTRFDHLLLTVHQHFDR